MKNHSGLTLIELLVSITILAIALALGVPSFTQLMQNNRMTSQTNEVVTLLNLARSEALQRGIPVRLRSTAANWGGNLEVAADTNGDGDLTDATDVLRVEDGFAYASAGAADSDGAVSFIEFRATGFLATNTSPPTPIVMTMTADDCRGNNTRAVTVALSGAISSAKLACP